MNDSVGVCKDSTIMKKELYFPVNRVWLKCIFLYAGFEKIRCQICPSIKKFHCSFMFFFKKYVLGQDNVSQTRMIAPTFLVSELCHFLFFPKIMCTS